MKNLLLLIFFFSYSITYSIEYHVEKSNKNNVKFISDAPIEEFEGNTDKIDGYLSGGVDANNLTGAEVYFEVDLTSVDTGIGLRNRHMRDNYLHTDKFPVAIFQGKISNFTKKAKDKYEVKVDGKFKLHGIEKKVSIDGIVTLLDKKMNIESKFILKLSDYKIEIPSIMFAKINEAMDMNVNFNLKRVD